MRLERLTELLARFKDLRVAVVGDLFLDYWLHIDPALDEPSVETGLTAWQITDTVPGAGAAGTILNNLRAMGVGRLYAVSFTGADGIGWQIKTLLEEQGVDTTQVLAVPERMTPAYIKPLFKRDGRMEEGNRLDIKNRRPTPGWAEEKLMASLEELAPKVDAIIALDQLTESDTGVLTARVREALAGLGDKYPKLILYADSRAWIGLYRNVMIKCNRAEAARALGGQLPLAQTMERLRQKTGRPVFVTLGKDGIAVDNGTVVPAARQTGPIDECGAGDAASAALVSSLCAGATHREAAELGNLSAGIAVRKLGSTGTATQEEMIALYHEQFEESI